MATTDIFLLMALVSTGIFLLQFVISVFFGDIDVDVDGDANTDFDLGSLLSFKGLIHFLMGFGWTKVVFADNVWTTYLGAVMVGLVFVLCLSYLYVLAFKLQNLRQPERPGALKGRRGRIYINEGDGRYTICIERDGAFRELDVVSLSGNAHYVTNETVTVEKYENNIYYIA